MNSFPITSIDLQNVLKVLLGDPNNQLGGSLLGTYTYEDSGLVEPSISIGNPPDDIKVVGLEVILPLFPDTVNEWTTENVHTVETWHIDLYQRTPIEGQSMTLPAAVHRLRCYFKSSSGSNIPQAQILGNYPGYHFSFVREDGYPVINKLTTIC